MKKCPECDGAGCVRVGRWLRPGPIAESRVLGRWPSAGTYGIWSDSLWHAANSAAPEPPANVVPEIGCDVARYGDDDTVIHARVGPVSVHHERHNGWDVVQTAGRLKELARELAAEYHTLVQLIPIKVDDDGVGGGVVDLRDVWREGPTYKVIPVNGGSTPRRPEDYPNKRSELWFGAAEQARHGGVCLGRLPRDVLDRLRRQAMAPTWKLDAAGRRVVERKDDTKKKLGRSPDEMDALNLCYYPAPSGAMAAHETPPRPAHERRRGFGPRR